MDTALKLIIVHFVGFWILGVVGVRNDNGIKQKEVYIPVWLNMILFLKNDHRALLGMFAFQISIYIMLILILLGYYFRPFNNNPLFVFYYLRMLPVITGGIDVLYLSIRYYQERKKNRRRL